jgi:hypothetical protein
MPCSFVVVQHAAAIRFLCQHLTWLAACSARLNKSVQGTCCYNATGMLPTTHTAVHLLPLGRTGKRILDLSLLLLCCCCCCCQVGGIRRIVVPVELGYPDNDYKKQGPKPTTFAVSAPFTAAGSNRLRLACCTDCLVGWGYNTSSGGAACAHGHAHAAMAARQFTVHRVAGLHEPLGLHFQLGSTC